MQKAAPKAETVTLKDLAAKLAEAHSLPKSQVNTLLTDLVGDLGKHLKKGARIRIFGLGILQVGSARRAWVAIPPPARPSRSRPARRLHSGHPRTSRNW